MTLKTKNPPEGDLKLLFKIGGGNTKTSFGFIQFRESKTVIILWE